MLESLIVGFVGFCAFFYYASKRCPWLWVDIKHMATLLRSGTLKEQAVKAKRLTASKNWVVNQFEAQAAKYPEKIFVIFEGQRFQYRHANQQSNKIANFAMEQGWAAGDVIAVCVHNEPSFLWTYFGLSKLGIVCAFINTNLRSKSLQHCIEVSGAKAVIVGQDSDLQSGVAAILPDLDTPRSVFAFGDPGQLPVGWQSIHDSLLNASSTQPDPSIRTKFTGRTPCCYIYTSGTTGLPKPAIVTHDRAIRGATVAWLCGVKHSDVFYTGLPLYHSSGLLLAVGGVVLEGATLVLKPKFSASQFWKDCREHDVTVIHYIGELCRFLLNRPEAPEDSNHNVRLAMGNGLRADIWTKFVDRFKIPNVVDFYAATEGNVGFINLFNKHGCIGRCSPLMQLMFPVAFLKYDFNTGEPVRTSHGHCIRAEIGEPGLLVCQIKKNTEFDGYAGKKENTEKKILRSVFKKGDAYFNSGDLIYADEEHYVYFSDRIGDTFRWKGENVSTTEVANVLCELDSIQDANVYGVSIPGSDGRCGMAALTLTESSNRDLSDVDLAALYRHCNENLTAYAKPRFLRVLRELNMTATFKQQKFKLVKEGFDPNAVSTDVLYYLDAANKTYSVLDEASYNAISNGKIRM